MRERRLDALVLDRQPLARRNAIEQSMAALLGGGCASRGFPALPLDQKQPPASGAALPSQPPPRAGRSDTPCCNAVLRWPSSCQQECRSLSDWSGNPILPEGPSGLAKPWQRRRKLDRLACQVQLSCHPLARGTGPIGNAKRFWPVGAGLFRLNAHNPNRLEAVGGDLPALTGRQAVQITVDLAGFLARQLPGIRAADEGR